MLLFRTVHGSTLYGLSRPDSDLDLFEVYGWDKARGRQKIYDGLDTTKTSLDRFLRYADKGVPQYVEAMFSTMADVDNISYLRYNWIPNLSNCRQVYIRTINNFWESEEFKKRRHAARLILGLRDLMTHGRMNPTLSPEQIAWVNHIALLDELPPIL